MFGSILSSLKSVASSVVSGLTGSSQSANALSSIKQEPGKQTYAPSASTSQRVLDYNDPVTAVMNTSGLTRQTIAPKTRSALPAGSVQNVIDQYADPNAGQSFPQSSASTSSRSSSGSSGGKKKSTPPPPPPTTATAGSTTMDFSSRIAAAGGGGGGSFGPTSPLQGGTGGSPSYTGTLSAVSGLGASNLSPGSNEEAELGSTPRFNPSVAGPALIRDTLSVILNGSETPERLETPNVASQFTSSDIGSGLAATPTTRESMNLELERIKTEALKIKEMLDAGLIDEPVEETPEQLQFLEQQDDPFGIAQAMDNYRRQETSLIQLQKQRMEIFNGIKAITDSYEMVYEDIRGNPDLPAGLAKRRLTSLAEKESKVLKNYRDMLEMTNSAIDDQNSMVNRAFNIVENVQDQEERARKRQMDWLNLYIDSGAIAGLNDSEINDLANSLGMNPKGLKHIRTLKQEEEAKRDLEIRQLDNGDTVVIDKEKGSIVSNLGGRTVKNPNSEENEPLDTIEVQRLSELYPNVGIVFGDTRAQAEEKILNPIRTKARYSVDNGLITSREELGRVYNQLSGTELDAIWAGKTITSNTSSPSTNTSFFSRLFGGVNILDQLMNPKEPF